MDRVAYRHDLRETPLDVAPQVCITRDNTQLQVDGILYFQVTDPRLADMVVMAGGGSKVPVSAHSVESGQHVLDVPDVTLMRGDLRAIPAAIRLSRLTMRNIKQNLFWAFFYNAVGIPVAAAGYLAPWLAAAAMAFSSVSVVSNSLRLKRVKI